jgi:hypothetical protein
VAATKKGAEKLPAKFVTVSNRSYGNALKGQNIYYEGPRPPALKDDGRIGFGKHLFEQLRKKFGKKIRWIITEETDSIEKSYGITYVRTSLAFLRRLNKENFARTRDIKNDILARNLSSTFPDRLEEGAAQGKAFVKQAEAEGFRQMTIWDQIEFEEIARKALQK